MVTIVFALLTTLLDGFTINFVSLAGNPEKGF